MKAPWGCSSIGRASDWQSEGRGFESLQLHQSFASESGPRRAVFCLAPSAKGTGQVCYPTPAIMDGDWLNGAGILAEALWFLAYRPSEAVLIALYTSALGLFVVGLALFFQFVLASGASDRARRLARGIIWSVGAGVITLLLIAIAFTVVAARASDESDESHVPMPTPPPTLTPTPTVTNGPPRTPRPTPTLTATRTRTSPCPHEGFRTIEDDSRFLRITVPSAWCDVGTGPLPSGDAAIEAAPDLGDFGSRAGAGVEFTASAFLLGFGSIDVLLDFVGSDPRLLRCTYERRHDYQRAPFVGKFDRWTNCDGPLTEVVVVAAVSPDGSFFALVTILMVSDEDLQAFDRIFNSWEVLTGSEGG